MTRRVSRIRVTAVLCLLPIVSQAHAANMAGDRGAVMPDRNVAQPALAASMDYVCPKRVDVNVSSTAQSVPGDWSPAGLDTSSLQMGQGTVSAFTVSYFFKRAFVAGTMTGNGQFTSGTMYCEYTPQGNGSFPKYYLARALQPPTTCKIRDDQTGFACR